MTKPSKIKYKQTKELVRIALNLGMTQDEIGGLCRVKQPQVSKWKKGDSLASLQQMQPLFDRFGHLLKRQPSKLYHYTAEQPNRYINVEGRILLRERFLNKQTKPSKNFPASIRLTVQIRRDSRFSLAVETSDAGSPQPSMTRDPAIAYWNDRFAVWSCSQFLDNLRADALVTAMDNYVEQQDLSVSFPKIAALPYMVREALLKYGNRSEGIAERL